MNDDRALQQRSGTNAAAAYEEGSIIRVAHAIHANAERTNGRLLRILQNLRHSPPTAIGVADTEPSPRRPLSDTMEHTEREQARTAEMLAEIESFIG